MDTARQIAEVARRMQPSAGYNFYRSLNMAIQAHIDQKSQDEIDYILNKSSSPGEVSYNKSAFNKFIERFGKKKKIYSFEKKGSFSLASGKLLIRVSPQFMVENAGVMTVYHVWTMQNPQMDKARASCACYILQEAFKKTAPNYEYKLFDAVSGKVYSGTNNTAALAVESVAENIAKWATM
ncbi:hypothetical protein [Agrobacterium leguminum]|uniref:hypothetical protein n=1 Tax=Agrobacterium leguminum TaxID=2792015 RepID=UPI003CE56654